MKKLITLCAAILMTASVIAQAPEKMSYQAVVRDGSNALVTSTPVGMQISILQGSASGKAVYVETQTQTTNANGLVSLEIGAGTVVNGDFATIDWSADSYFIKTETDPTGGTSYTVTGTSQLLSVPYALHANTADSIVGGVSFTEVDGSVTNEIQALTMSNGILYLSNGGSVKLPAGFDGQYTSLTGAPTNVSTFTNDAKYLKTFTEVDGSVTNEIQNLALSGNNLTITNNGWARIIDLSPYLDNTDTQLDETEVDDFVANNGFLKTEVDGSVTNEIQTLSMSNGTLSLSNNGGSVNLPAGFDGQYTSLTGAPTNVSAFTNNAGYLTSFTEVDGSITNEIELPTTANSGDMNYWNGSAWVVVAATPNEGAALQMISGVPTWVGGTPPTFLQVTSATTGKIWMDRNLGASQVATSSTDAASFGDYYQWGRGTDGHEKLNAGTTQNQSSTDTPGHSDFIIDPNNDAGLKGNWRNPTNANLWQGVNGVNNPCPSGYRLPTKAEWDEEFNSWGANKNATGAFASNLKLPEASQRLRTNGTVSSWGGGYYWTMDNANDDNAYVFNFYSTTQPSGTGYNLKMRGYSVRCIQN